MMCYRQRAITLPRVIIWPVDLVMTCQAMRPQCTCSVKWYVNSSFPSLRVFLKVRSTAPKLVDYIAADYLGRES
jgi:hypothetical protein